MLEFDFVIYPRRLWVGNEQELIDNFTDRNNKKPELDDNYTTITYPVIHKQSKIYGWFIIINDELNADIAAHEATHVALDLFNDIDTKVDYTNQEPLAYLVGFTCKCILKYKE